MLPGTAPLITPRARALMAFAPPICGGSQPATTVELGFTCSSRLIGGVEIMSESVPRKRRRGAQPGNQNAKNNRGNLHPRRNRGNRGGKGAPNGNQFARKPCRSASTILIEDYKNNSEACSW